MAVGVDTKNPAPDRRRDFRKDVDLKIALRCNNVDLTVCLIESYFTVSQSEECVVTTHAYVFTRVETCAALAEDDVACDYGFAAEFLNAEAL